MEQIIHHSAVGAGSNLERFAGRGWEIFRGGALSTALPVVFPLTAAW